MNKKVIMVTTLVLLAALLAALPGLVGCGKEEVVTGRFIYGWVQDFTGRAGFGVKQVYDGVEDCLSKTAEENPIPGVVIKQITYDTKSDYSRVVPGYVWLRGQKANLLSVTNQDTLMLTDRMATDEQPQLYMSNMPQLVTNEWFYTVYGTSSSMVEVLLQWLRDNWDYNAKGKPKLGCLTYSGVLYYKSFVDTLEAVVSQYPDKYNYIGTQAAPTTTTAWATEVFKLKDCDIIFCFLSGTPLASFVKEARDRGFQGQFMGPLDSFPAFWGLVRGAVPVAQLDGILTAMGMPAIDEPNNPFINGVRAYMQQHRSADQIKAYSLGTGYATGWAMGMILVDIVRRAAAEVGAANVGNISGSALRDLIRETNLTVDGWGEAFKYRGNLGTLSRTVMMYRFNAAQDKWVSTSGWFVPASLAVAGE